MKKRVLLWVTAVLCAALTACGGADAETAKDSGKETTANGKENGKETTANGGGDEKETAANGGGGEKPAEEENVDTSLPTFNLFQADIVGSDVFLIWNNGGGSDEELKVEILRAADGSNDFEVVGSVGKTKLGFVQHSYIDSGAGSGSYRYKVRAAKGGKYGKMSKEKAAEPTPYKWYKSDDGEYICMRPWSSGTADFTGFDANFDVVWNCDWSYSRTGDDTYSVGMFWDPGDGGEVYNESFEYLITNEIFKDLGNGHTSYSLNDVPISIE